VKLGDSLALELQRLRREGKIEDEPGLLRIDYRKESGQAPFHFDIARGKLHRNGCPAIPRDSKSAVYGVWDPGSEPVELACERCRPARVKVNNVAKTITSDIVFGLISILDQFGSVLSERGKEYRDSDRGKEISKHLGDLMTELDRRQQEALTLTLASLDTLLGVMQSFSADLRKRENGDRQNGNHRRKPKISRRKNGPKKR
jgi:hypothetical protein